MKKNIHLMPTRSPHGSVGLCSSQSDRISVARLLRYWRQRSSKAMIAKRGSCWYETESEDSSSKEWIWWLTTQKEVSWS